MNTKYISFGKTKFDTSMFNLNPTHEKMTKPEFGLWASCFKENERFYSAWEEWCYNEWANIRSDALTFDIQDDSNVFKIHEMKDFMQLLRMYPKIKTINIKNGILISDIGIDFEKMTEEYEGIELTERGFENAVLEEFELKGSFAQLLGDKLPDNCQNGNQEYNISFDDWQVPSICIFKPDIMKNIESFINDHKMRVNKDNIEAVIEEILDRGKTKKETMESLLKMELGESITEKEISETIDSIIENNNRIKLEEDETSEIIEMATQEIKRKDSIYKLLGTSDLQLLKLPRFYQSVIVPIENRIDEQLKKFLLVKQKFSDECSFSSEIETINFNEMLKKQLEEIDSENEKEDETLDEEIKKMYEIELRQVQEKEKIEKLRAEEARKRIREHLAMKRMRKAVGETIGKTKDIEKKLSEIGTTKERGIE